jgi:hypothetical protein
MPSVASNKLTTIREGKAFTLLLSVSRYVRIIKVTFIVYIYIYGRKVIVDNIRGVLNRCFSSLRINFKRNTQIRKLFRCHIITQGTNQIRFLKVVFHKITKFFRNPEYLLKKKHENVDLLCSF